MPGPIHCKDNSKRRNEKGLFSGSSGIYVSTQDFPDVRIINKHASAIIEVVCA